MIIKRLNYSFFELNMTKFNSKKLMLKIPEKSEHIRIIYFE
jgi:hypothetical protein